MKKLFGSLLLALSMSVPVWAAVDVNTATQSELEAVRGIGPVKAKAIVEYREKYGAFRNLDDLTGVKGLGKASVEKLKGELEVKPMKEAAR
ncbi:MAG: ComEA family DNA-binding protein [Thiotrichales bacterium]